MHEVSFSTRKDQGPVASGLLSARPMKEPTITIGRREFTLQGVLALLGGVTITMAGCGTDSPTGPSPSGGATGTISENHGHAVSITQAELTAGNALNLTLSTGDGHTHTVSLTGDEVMAIDNGQIVAKTSSVNALHDHDVSFAKNS